MRPRWVKIEGVEELKKKCKDKGCKERSPPYNLRQKPGQCIIYRLKRASGHGKTEHVLTAQSDKSMAFPPLPQALINENLLKERQKCSSKEVSKIISRLKIKISSLKLKYIKSKIKIQDHKHAKGTLKEFPSIQGSKIQDVTRSEAISYQPERIQAKCSRKKTAGGHRNVKDIIYDVDSGASTVFHGMVDTPSLQIKGVIGSVIGPG
ncbi:hypothetical protein Tco_0888326 [Tanacetum coccineum]